MPETALEHCQPLRKRSSPEFDSNIVDAPAKITQVQLQIGRRSGKGMLNNGAPHGIVHGEMHREWKRRKADGKPAICTRVRVYFNWPHSDWLADGLFLHCYLYHHALQSHHSIFVRGPEGDSVGSRLAIGMGR